MAENDKEQNGAASRDNPSVNWDDSQMRTTYANVVNGTASREEVTVFFGTNLTWNPADAKDYQIKLSDRIILTPFAAKRLTVILTRLLADYERRYGKLAMPTSSAEAPGPQ